MAWCDTNRTGQDHYAQSRQFLGEWDSIFCPQIVPERVSFQMMMEIPDRRDASRRTSSRLQRRRLYCILSGVEYRVGMKFLTFRPNTLI